MKVKELRELLIHYSDDTLVVLSKDGDGNEFSPLADHCGAMYIADSTFSGHIEAEGDEGEDSGAVLALILWPTN
jgi:hypothetical protein